MFNPSINDVRSFFYDTYNKAINNQSLTDLEKVAYAVMLEHPEYNSILNNKDKYFDFKWDPKAGETNPFLHMSMHISICEQLSINQPVGITDLYQKMCVKYDSKHNAEHLVMDCLGEMIWQAQVNKVPMDSEVYLSCMQAKL